jgi:hypothetical protein
VCVCVRISLLAPPSFRCAFIYVLHTHALFFFRFYSCFTLPQVANARCVRPSGYNVSQEVPTLPASDQCMGMQMQPGIGQCAGINRGLCFSTCKGHSDCEFGSYCANITGEPLIYNFAAHVDVPHGLGVCQSLEYCMFWNNDAIDCHCNASDVPLGNGCVAWTTPHLSSGFGFR